MTSALPSAVARQRVDIATVLEPLDSATRAEIMTHEIITHGGTFIPSCDDSTWGPHFAEVSLLGISHTGNSTDECIANWIKAVLRSAQYEVAA